MKLCGQIKKTLVYIEETLIKTMMVSSQWLPKNIILRKLLKLKQTNVTEIFRRR